MELNQNQEQTPNTQEEQNQGTLEENLETTNSNSQSQKLYTEDEFNEAVNSRVNDVLNKKIPRTEAKIRKEYADRYGRIENVLKAGTGNDNLDDIASSLEQYYQSKGKKIPAKPEFSERDTKILAVADANDIIESGDDEVTEEINRLVKLGADKMTARDKIMFQQLSNHLKAGERAKALAKIGADEAVVKSKEFETFAAQFAENTPVETIYDYFQKTQTQNQKQIKQMGSMKNTDSTDNGVKDFYTPEEAKKFTRKDFDNNPALFEAVLKSMRKWKK